MKTAYNEMPLDEKSRRLTQFFNGNQQYDFNRILFVITIGPAVLSAFVNKIFRPHSQQKRYYIIFRRCFHTTTNKTKNV